MIGVNHRIVETVYGPNLMIGTYLLFKYYVPQKVQEGSIFYQSFDKYFFKTYPTWIGQGFLCLLLFYFGSMLVDICADKSSLGKLRVKYLPWLEIEHRKWTHTIYWIAIVILGSLLFHNLYFYYLGIGALFHLIMDTFSRMGVCWFKPNGYRKFGSNGAKIKQGHKWYLYRTSHWSETLFTVVVTVLGLLLLYFMINHFSLLVGFHLF